jgi:hypothetical protein
VDHDIDAAGRRGQRRALESSRGHLLASDGLPRWTLGTGPTGERVPEEAGDIQ